MAVYGIQSISMIKRLIGCLHTALNMDVGELAANGRVLKGNREPRFVRNQEKYRELTRDL